MMTSILTPETTFFWLYDNPELMARFRDLLAEKMVELSRILRRFSGNTDQGWWIADDNCALFNEELYREYCFPVLKRVMDTLAPGDSPGTNIPTAPWDTFWTPSGNWEFAPSIMDPPWMPP